jgi:hypothetical protein
MTSPDVARTSVACEVKLYLAIPSPSSSSPLSPLVSSLAHHRSAAGPVLGSPPPRLEFTVPVHALLDHLNARKPRSCEGSH